MSIPSFDILCRLCLNESDSLYRLDSDFSILVLDSGDKVTIGDALAYLNMQLFILPEKQPDQDGNVSESEEEAKTIQSDDPQLPKSLCKTCLEQLQTAYEFKFRANENKIFLKNYLKEQVEAKIAEENAAREAALLALDLDINNLDKLPDRLVLKDLKKSRKPRKPRDPSKPIVRKKRDEEFIIADESQVENALYVRKLITTPEQSPDAVGTSNKRKSKHVILQDIVVPKKITYTDTKKSTSFADDEPEFEDDREPPKKRGRPKKVV